MKAGLSDSRSSFLSYGIGGFILLKSLNADASIIPDSDRPYFNEEANIYDMEGFGAGLLAGVSGYFNLPGDFFATAYIAPGIGLDYKYVKSEAGNYRPTNPMIYKTDLFGSLGYNRKRFYVHFTFGTDLYLTSLDYSNQVFLSVTKSKFIIGYNLGK